MIRALPALVVALLIACAAPAATEAQLADDPFSFPLPRVTTPPQDVGADGRLGAPSPRTSIPGGRTADRPRSRRPPRNGRRCVRVGTMRTCTTYRRGRAVRVCVKRGDAPQRCRRPRVTRPRGIGASAAANVAEGFYSGDAPVGRLFASLPGGTLKGLCSGTLIGPAVVLTAAHCLYDPTGGLFGSGSPGYLWDTFSTPILFVPNNQFASNFGLTEAENAYAPYGSSYATSTSVPACWPGADLHCDVGLVFLSHRLGDVTGWYPTAYGVCCSVGQRVVSAGYPGAGAFARYEYGMGNAPFSCTNDLEASSAVYGSQLSGPGQTGVIQLHSCGAHKGISGGPVWTQLSDGGWYLTGVNNVGMPPDAEVQTLGGFQPFDDTFASFYCAVLGCGRR